MSAGSLVELMVGGGTVDFARVFDAVPDPCLLLTPELVICGANRAYLRATSRTLDGLAGQFVFDAFPDNPTDPAADGVANLRTSLERVLTTRQSHVMAVQKYDIEVSTGDGLRFEERYWSPVNVLVLGADGRVEVLIHRVLDVTELVRAGAGTTVNRGFEKDRDAAGEEGRPSPEPLLGTEHPGEGGSPALSRRRYYRMPSDPSVRSR